MAPNIPDSKLLYEENLDGESEYDLARKYHVTRSTIHNRIYRYKQSLKEKEFDFSDEEKEEERYDHKNENVKTEFDGNTGWATSKSRTIKTLDGLLKASETDLDIWEVIRHVINKWDVTNKYGRVYTNWQVKAWLARKEPIDIFPDISPVVFPLSTLKRPTTKIDDKRGKTTVRHTLIVSDPHFGFDKNPTTQELKPYHDERALQIALDIFSDNDFDYLIWGGDILDCNEWSTHWIKRPEFRQTTQPAINEAARWIASFIDAKPYAEHIAIKGNHDDRIEEYIVSNLDEIYNLVPGDDPDAEPLMSISNFLGLKRMGVKYLDSYRIGRTLFIHGDLARKGGGMTARAHIENTVSNIVFAHVHRRELVTETRIGYDGKMIEVFSMCPGCACHIDGRLPGSEDDDNWQEGIGVLSFVDDECVSHQIIKIENSVAEYNGKLYFGQ